MKTRLFLSTTLCAILLSGMALAADPPLAGGENSNFIVTDGSPAAMTQDITLSIPKRVALHITETEWRLDLNNLSDPEMTDLGPKGCFMVPKTYQFPQVYTPAPVNTSFHAENLESIFIAALADELPGMAVYPAVDGNQNNSIEGDHDKGTLVCLNYKVIQKFCNISPYGSDLGGGYTSNPQCELDVKFIRTASNNGFLDYGQFFVHDRILQDTLNPGSGGSTYESFRFLNPGDTAMLVHLEQGDRFVGWQDDLFYEGFYFDGSEVAGGHKFRLVFTLSAVF